MDGITCSTPLRKWVGEEIRASVNSPARPRLATLPEAMRSRTGPLLAGRRSLLCDRESVPSDILLLVGTAYRRLLQCGYVLGHIPTVRHPKPYHRPIPDRFATMTRKVFVPVG